MTNDYLLTDHAHALLKKALMNVAVRTCMYASHNRGSSHDSKSSDSGDDGDSSVGNRSDGGDMSSDSSSDSSDFPGSDSSSGSSDSSSSGTSASSSSDDSSFDEGGEEEDVFSSGAFQRCVLNFCSGEWDDEIRTALNTHKIIIMSANGPADPRDGPGGRDAEAESSAREALQRDLRRHIDTIESFSTVRRAVQFKVDLLNRRLGTVLSHCESLDACWKDFSDALAAHENVSLSNLIINGVHLTGDILDMLASSLRGRIERSIRFIRNDMHQNGIASIVPLLEDNPTLLDLCLCHNPMTDFPAARQLFEAVKEHPNLRSVDLSRCRIGDNIPILFCILNCGAMEVVLNCNGIGSEGSAAIARYLEGDPPLEHLELEQNRFVDDDAVRLAGALKKNRHLRTIFLRRNRFSVAGAKTLFRAIFDASSMNAMSDSNHNCQVCLFPNVERVQRCIVYLNAECREAARMTKLIMVLSSSKEALLQYMEQVPLEFMPKVLSLVQVRGKDEKEWLTMVYTIMRWWDMPSLYAYHHPECPRSKKKRKKRREV